VEKVEKESQAPMMKRSEESGALQQKCWGGVYRYDGYWKENRDKKMAAILW